MGIRVKVHLFANLRRYGPGGKGVAELQLGLNATVGLVIEALNLPPQVQRVILVNGRHANEDNPLTDGDEVVLFPPLAGG